MIYYESVKVIINNLKLAEVILDVIIWYYNLYDLIVSNKGLLFIFKFWLSLYYFFDIK